MRYRWVAIALGLGVALLVAAVVVPTLGVHSGVIELRDEDFGPHLGEPNHHYRVARAFHLLPDLEEPFYFQAGHILTGNFTVIYTDLSLPGFENGGYRGEHGYIAAAFGDDIFLPAPNALLPKLDGFRVPFEGNYLIVIAGPDVRYAPAGGEWSSDGHDWSIRVEGTITELTPSPWAGLQLPLAAAGLVALGSAPVLRKLRLRQPMDRSPPSPLFGGGAG